MPRRSKNLFEGGFSLPKLEEEVLSFWEEARIFEKSLERNKRGKEFVFYEGPPYANGKPGIHHVLARVVKDVVLRYKTMRGYYVPRRAGWDTHGLPVEMAAEKALGFKTKRDIEKFGVKNFNEEAKKQVWMHEDEWERLTKRIGYWLDLKNAYVTYAPEYIETIWWTLSEIWRRKLLYKGHKVVQWCTRCGTALSSHELAQGYQKVTDNSAYVKFKLKKGQRIGNFTTDDSTYALSWTTTPWTLPGNVALAVGEEIAYELVRTTAPDKASYIVAKNLVSSVMKDSDFAAVGEIPGRRLVGLEYEPLFEVKAFRGSAAAYKIHSAGFVTTTDGTGIVHTAVMYGEDDYELGKKIGLPERHTVDEEGKFTSDVPGLAGEYVKSKETEEKIFERLRRAGGLFRIEPYEHEYPHCWRCGTPILYYARTSWFIKMSALRRELLARNKGINWMPEHVRNGRFGEWLREAKDWNLSRERYWGAPLPIWECSGCGHTEVVGGLDGLSRLAGGAKNRYWAMRHGEAEGNVFTIIDSGKMKFHLTPRGRKQAEASAKKFAAALSRKRGKIDMIISSDIMRARETAEIAASILGVKEIVFDKRIEEIHLGPLSGKHIDEYWRQFKTIKDRFEKKPEGGETLRDVRARAWDFLKDCEARYAGKDILIVSHEDPIWMMSQIGSGWSENEAAKRRKAERGGFMNLASIFPLEMKVIPRDDTGMVDLHRPFVDGIKFPCVRCAAAGRAHEMKRVPEVADVWYDSGAMPLAQAHFPFDLPGASSMLAKGVRPLPEKHIAYPADYIAEGMDQTRGWFYTLLAIATALGYKAPYRNVITFGLVNDKFGQKMSKSKGNVIDPFSIIDKYGVDALRWQLFTGTPFGEPKDFDENDVAQAFRKTHLIIYNSFVFLKTYASKSGSGPAAGRAAASAAAARKRNVLDRWIESRLAELESSITKKLNKYEVREAALEIDEFVDDLSRWYIRRSRRRFQRPSGAADYRAASATLWRALFRLSIVMAPFTPFFSEALFAALGGKAESVHLEKWPMAGKAAGRSAVDAKLNASMKAVREAAALGLAKRAEAGIKVRQPLASLSIGARLAPDLADVLAEEVNVKKIVYAKKLGGGVALDTAITAELREEGLLRDAARLVQELRQKAGLSPKDRIILVIGVSGGMKDVIMKREAALRSDVGAKAVEYGRSDKFIAEEDTKMEGEPFWLGIRKAK